MESIKYWQKRLNESTIAEEKIKIVNSLLDMIDEDDLSESSPIDDPNVAKMNMSGLGFIAYHLITKIAVDITGSFSGAHNVAWITGKQLDNSLNRFRALKRLEVDEFKRQKSQLRQFMSSSNSKD